MQWNQKERDLLKDLKDQEQLCVDKYMRHAENACDPQLKKLFSQLAQQEAQHLQTIHQMESGTVPQMQSGSGQQRCSAQNQLGGGGKSSRGGRIGKRGGVGIGSELDLCEQVVERKAFIQVHKTGKGDQQNAGHREK